MEKPRTRGRYGASPSTRRWRWELIRQTSSKCAQMGVPARPAPLGSSHKIRLGTRISPVSPTLPSRLRPPVKAPQNRRPGDLVRPTPVRQPRGFGAAGAHRRLGRNPRLSSRLNLSPRDFDNIVSRAMRGNDRQAFEGVRQRSFDLPKLRFELGCRGQAREQFHGLWSEPEHRTRDKGFAERRCQTLASGQRLGCGQRG